MKKKNKKIKEIKEKLKSIDLSTSLREKKEKEKLSFEVKRTKVIVIGIGGGGGSIVSELSSKVKKASFLAANTDRQALRNLSRKISKFHFGESFTRGLGTGMDWQLAQEAAQAEKERIKKIFRGYDFCVFVACLGGGTGSGALPIFAKIARNFGILSYGIFTLPFKFEGERKAQVARETLERLKPYLNAISIIPNERIFQIVQRSTPLKIALSAINKNLAENLSGLIETIYEPGLINIDFADLKTVFEGRGRLTYLNSVIIPSLEKNEEYQKTILSSPLYPYNMRGARGVLLNIVGEKPLLLSEVAQLSRTISDLASSEAKIIFGIGQRKVKGLTKGGAKITLLATGCVQKLFQKEKRKTRKKKIKPKENRKTESSPSKEKKRLKKQKKVNKKTSLLSSENQSSHLPQEKKKLFKKEVSPAKKIEIKIRRSALDVRKQIEQEEREILEKEKEWEFPAFLKKEE